MTLSGNPACECTAFIRCEIHRLEFQFQEGFKKGLKEAAKVAEAHYKAKPFHDDTTCNCPNVIADKIRALAQK